MNNLLILLKSVTYRIFASSITSLIAYIFTGNLTLSLGIGVFEFISKVFAYYIFEQIWIRIARFITHTQYRQNCFKLNKYGSVLLISGLNCSGKTTLAKELINYIPNCILLDGDAVRKTINYDLGFSDVDIHTNLTKVANLTNLLNDQGYNVIISCIAKHKNDRTFIKETLQTNDYNEIYVYCNDDELKKRQAALHPKTKVIQTGYEESDYTVIKVNTSKNSVSKCVKEVLCLIQKD